ncbi:MAG: glycoside hydrolase/phage tail family protein [Hyphomicrobiales bacterium]
MATLALSMVGEAAGAALGSTTFATLGRAAGALAGYAVDATLFGGRGSHTNRTYEGPRLTDLDIQASSEGAPIPRVYGRARVSGQIIWATRFEEVVVTETETATTSSGGGKGFGGGSSGSTSTVTRTTRTYRYFANFAVGLCEGPINRIGRIWADGELLDTSAVTVRHYRGTATQRADSLIEAKEGGDVPAYGDLAYVVFERLPLEAYGNRLPQLTFEVTRPLPGLEKQLKAMTVIPGATEFGYEPARVVRTPAPGVTKPENNHLTGKISDWDASIDELQALCPNLESVSLVVTWFGTDLRAGACRLRPSVDNRVKVTSGATWKVAGLDRSTATLVSLSDGHPAFGGTPSDASVIHAIRNLRSRGYKVMLHPFVMMDIPAGNALANPWTGTIGQPPYPWRGRITCHPAPGRSGTPDGSATVLSQIAAFLGDAEPGDFSVSGSSVVYSGPAEWSFRRMMLHYACLADIAGGIDAFLIGSELRGLTQLRSAPGVYPFVSALVDLAADVRQMLGSTPKISYGADWSEYFGHQPDDGSGDVYFHLDPFWASSHIGFIGIDNYMPLSDWRPAGDHLDAANAPAASDPAYLRANIAAGERFDWYYASDADRVAQVRTPVTDGAAGKPWVFRVKDLVGWWSNRHYNRPGGVESATPTAWQAGMKPIRFTEIGCPAIDLGANQPNVFVDPKSAESAYPWFSSGRRDDDVQRAMLAAVHRWWDPDDPDFEEAANPVSPVYGGRMVDPARLHVWAWDARPFPAFPYMRDVWADGDNWRTGHWLNGRLGAISLSALVAALLDRAGFADYDVSGLRGVVDGYVVDRPMSARDALDPLMTVGLIEAIDNGSVLKFRNRDDRPVRTLVRDELVEETEQPLVSLKRAEETELPVEVTIGYTGSLLDYRRAVAASRRLAGHSRGTVSAELAAILDADLASRIAEDWLHDLWAARETAEFALPPSAIALEPGDVVRLVHDGAERLFEITTIAEAGRLRLSARGLDPRTRSAAAPAARTEKQGENLIHGKPLPLVLDLPLLPGDEASTGARIAVFADPGRAPLPSIARRPARAMASLPPSTGRRRSARSQPRWRRVLSVSGTVRTSSMSFFRAARCQPAGKPCPVRRQRGRHRLHRGRLGKSSSSPMPNSWVKRHGDWACSFAPRRERKT